MLKYGAVPLAFQPLSTQSISPQLGASQLSAGLIAAAIGLLLVVLYSVLYYRGLAIVSVFSLATAALITWLSVIMLSKYQGYTLSLAGVAGLIVAIGITADSFVVYFERLRDEVREGRSLRAAVERGWQRARRTILVSDTVSFLAALLLYIIAIGDVRGFAFTLGLTTLIDIVVVFLFTKPMVSLLARTEFFGRGHKWSGLDPARLGAKSPWRGSRAATARPAAGTASATSATRGPDHPEGGVMSGLGNIGGRLYRGEVSFDFVGRQKLWYRISGAILAVSVIALLVFRLNFSVDFKGGSVYKFTAPGGDERAGHEHGRGGGQPVTRSRVQQVGSTQLDRADPGPAREDAVRGPERDRQQVPPVAQARSASSRSGRAGAARSRRRRSRR